MGNSLSKLNKIIKYDNGFIYTIYHQDNLIYVGSTIDFKVRLSAHKTNCYNVKRPHYNTPIYQYIRSNGDWKDYKFKIIDIYYNITKKLLTKIEGDYMKYFNFDKLLNREIAGRTKEEYYLDNKTQIKAKTSKPWTCGICNKTIKVKNKSSHLKTPRHINKVNNQ